VSVTHWRRTGSAGGYSTHGQTRMFTSGGAVLPSVAFNGQRRYTVSPGQTVRVEFTFENSGRSWQSSMVGYYLSTRAGHP
jgi:hypothetical protein